MTQLNTVIRVPVVGLSLLRPHRGAQYCDISVCLFVCPRAYGPISSDLHQFLYMLPITVARSSSDDVAICYILPVLWTTSHLHMAKAAQRGRPAEARPTRSLGLGYNGLTGVLFRRRSLGLLGSSGLVAMLC